jgi:death-on-curing protein
MKEPIWLSRQILMLLHAEALAEHGGLDGVRDPGLLDSALSRPANRLAYEGERDLCRLAAAYAAGIVRNHPFADGNKRAAFSCQNFLNFAFFAFVLACKNNYFITCFNFSSHFNLPILFLT